MTTRTWCDGFGAWHCEVSLPTGNAATHRPEAEAAIRAEIRARNPRDILTGLRFIGVRRDGEAVISHWREEDGT